MTFGAIIAGLILMYLSRRFPLFAAIGALICVILIAGFFYFLWMLCYPNDLWYFWILLAVGIGFWCIISLANKALHAL